MALNEVMGIDDHTVEELKLRGPTVGDQVVIGGKRSSIAEVAGTRVVLSKGKEYEISDLTAQQQDDGFGAWVLTTSARKARFEALVRETQETRPNLQMAFGDKTLNLEEMLRHVQEGTPIGIRLLRMLDEDEREERSRTS